VSAGEVSTPDAAPIGFWRFAADHPDLVAVIDPDGTSTTFRELLSLVRRTANGLRARGVSAGDHIAMAMPNHHAFFVVLLAAHESGLIITPINIHLAASEAAYVLGDSEAKVFFAHHDVADVAAVAAVEAGLGEDVCYGVGRIDGFQTIDHLWSDDDAAPRPRAAGATMLYTSGTTGKPKGVNRALPAGDPDDIYGQVAEVTCRGFGVPVGPHAHLVCGPLYHAGPMVGAVNALHIGATVVLVDRWTPEACLALIEKYHVASTQMVPTMFHRLLGLPTEVREAADVSSIRSVFHTGAPCPTAVKQQMMDWWGPVVYETYGGTEGVATIATPRRWLAKPGTVGKAIHGTTVHILDEDGNELPAGELGDIWIESAAGPSEYFKDPAKTAKMRRGRMITLGDVGYLDEDGFLFLRDRKIDMIISGGVNIYPAEVEAALLTDPDIADATVIGVPDKEWGEQVKAIVELRPDVPADATTEAAIIERCRGRIANFKCPRTVDFVDTLPRLPNGKVEKRRIRDKFWAAQDAAI
jgi:long-chain acyl-CoA synthetase